MKDYYVNKNAQSNGDHEVHESGCYWLPMEKNRIPLGKFYTCGGAVSTAKNHYDQVNGCKHCSEPCHTS
ncbi:hypothetical protein IMCC3317_24620 [Kordia antarctica]|uniref:Uncharacterized protein n=1 Tax=Kordia antarctica TaxID=1218801 RepID=A0A7L4ZMC8_9FLAO|nr:hypothetical protein [Kordia antarctica]QHI37084.1 hypothetical protein IMCC3317_24620 [Kordia antarctica]